MEKPSYVKWIVKENNVVFEDGVALDCYLLDYSIDDEILDMVLHPPMKMKTAMCVSSGIGLAPSPVRRKQEKRWISI